MKRFLIGTAFLALLTGCGSNPAPTKTAEDMLSNPLYAEWYYDDLVDHLVSLEIQNDTSLDDAGAKAASDEGRRDGLAKAKEATKKQSEGIMGAWVSDKEEIQGEVLLLGNMLYLGPSFMTRPGLDLRLYVTTTNDPREGTFPDENALEVGRLDAPYFPQSYKLSALPEGVSPRTVVLYDVTLKRISGFVQLRQQQ